MRIPILIWRCTFIQCIILNFTVLLADSSSTTIVKQHSLLMDQILTRISPSLHLQPSPGFAYQFGCSDWSASGFEGTVTSFKGDRNKNSPVHWVGRSEMRQSQSPSSSSSSSSSCKVLSRSDLLVFMAPENDIPHLRMSCTHYEDESSLLYFDLLPRVDLVANIDYYDAYYQKMSISSVTFSSSQLPVLSRIVLSPFGTMQSIPSEKDFEKQSSLAVESYCTHFLSCSEVYQKSLTSNVNKETTEASNLLRRARDISLHKLLLDDTRFLLAEAMGADFAPKASDIAAAWIGPTLEGDLYLL